MGHGQYLPGEGKYPATCGDCAHVRDHAGEIHCHKFPPSIYQVGVLTSAEYPKTALTNVGCSQGQLIGEPQGMPEGPTEPGEPNYPAICGNCVNYVILTGDRVAGTGECHYEPPQLYTVGALVEAQWPQLENGPQTPSCSKGITLP